MKEELLTTTEPGGSLHPVQIRQEAGQVGHGKLPLSTTLQLRIRGLIAQLTGSGGESDKYDSYSEKRQ